MTVTVYVSVIIIINIQDSRVCVAVQLGGKQTAGEIVRSLTELRMGEAREGESVQHYREK